MNKGKFITLEGIEGAGKSTAMNFIKRYLSSEKNDVVWTREPGGTPLAETLREFLLHRNSTETITPETELLLMFAGRAQHIQHVILPALQAGKWVVSDRFIDASYAYQGGGRQLPLSSIQFLDEWIVRDCRPDLTLLLDVLPEIGVVRAEKRGMEKDRIEKEKQAFFVRVREAYLQQAKREPERIKIIDASLPLPDVEHQIKHILQQWMMQHV